MMNIRVEFYKGSEMVNAHDPWYDIAWHWDAVPEWEHNIDPDETYVVKEGFEHWECGGLAGDGEGEIHEVISIQVVPPAIRGVISNIKSLQKTLYDYKSQILEENE